MREPVGYCPTHVHMRSRAWALVAWAALGAPQVAAQSSGFPFELPSFLQGASTPAPSGNNAATLAPKTSLERAAAGQASGQRDSAKALADLKPDVNCSRPQEGFDVVAKVVQYGGENARLRLQRLVASDFRYDDLTPQDREMLKVVAYTTVWVPPSLESKLGAIYSGMAGDKGDESHSASARRSVDRIELLKQQVADFPGEIRLLVLKDMPSGAAAQAGGLITIAQGFLSDLEAQPSARDLILAHELSHVYKRHALKEIQFQLVSTSAGFSIAKRLLGRAMPGSGGNFLTEAFGTIQLGVELVNFVRGLQIHFNRDQEFEADACAVVWMKRAKLDTTEAWKAFETASAAPGQAGSYFDQHPSSKERRTRFVAGQQKVANQQKKSLPSR
jgi:Zn-dependent protease with chaperone function